MAQHFRDLVSKPLQYRQPLRRSLNNFRLGLENSPPFPFDEHSHHLAHAPAGRAEDLQSVHARNEKRNAVLANYADALGIAFKGLQLKSRKVESLKLFGGIRHVRIS